MADRIERITPAYRGVMIASTPGVVWWGRLHVTGLELLPLEGPLLLVGDHDSYWDTVTAGIAALGRRQIRALAKSSMWKNRLLGAVLTGMGQIPIDRGSGNTGALDRAIEELRNGACIGIYPEGTRSLGRVLRARSGVGYMARAVPEATIIGGACSGTVAIPRFPEITSARASRVLRVRSTRDRARGVTAGVQHAAARANPSPCTNRGRGPYARRSARRPCPHLVPGASDHRQTRRQRRARGGARPDRPDTELSFLPATGRSLPAKHRQRWKAPGISWSREVPAQPMLRAHR